MGCTGFPTFSSQWTLVARSVRFNYSVHLSFCVEIALNCRSSEAEPDSTSLLLVVMVAFKSKSPKLQVQSNMLETDLNVCIPSGFFRKMS